MPTIPELLTESEKNIKELAKEIQTFKSSRILNEKATNSLESTTKALIETQEAIKPFQSSRFKRLSIFLIFTSIINFLLIVIILLKLFLFK